MIEIPAAFAKNTIRREGDAGRRWLAHLPGLVMHLCRRWAVTIDGPTRHGYLGVVVPVRRGNTRWALKVAWPNGSSDTEAAALRAWAGQGAVRLIEADHASNALLLERLDPTQTLATVPIGEALEIAGSLLRRLAIAAPPHCPTLQAQATALATSLNERWERFEHPMPASVVRTACEWLLALPPTTEQCLVNYDLHYDNVLAGEREPWLVIDPKVVAGPLEFGVAQLLWCRLEEIEAAGGLPIAITSLCRAAALDPANTMAWTLVRCVEYWLWGLSVGLTEDPARCRRIIAALATDVIASP